MGTATNIKIIKGEDREIILKLVDSEGEPYDLAGYTELTAKFPNADGTTLSRTYTSSGGVTVLSEPGGKIQVALTDAQTALLNASDERQDFELIIDKGTARRIVQFKKGLLISSKIFT